MADLGVIDIPDALPVLSRGNHKPGSGKACIMDAISIVSGQAHEQDHPSAVHPLLRPLFITLNDSATDTDRQLLWTPGLKAWGTGVDGDLDPGETRRLIVGLLLGQARRRLSGRKIADHPAVRVLPAVLAWQQKPGYQTRMILRRATAVGQAHAVVCPGCSLVLAAATATHGDKVAIEAYCLRSGLFPPTASWADRYEALNSLLDDWLTMLPAQECRPEQAREVPWDDLAAQLGVDAMAGTS
jgi:hypothetical protein